MFTQEQVRELVSNKNVVKCSPKSITYNKEFKIQPPLYLEVYFIVKLYELCSVNLFLRLLV
jgi:hypothetical protein